MGAVVIKKDDVIVVCNGRVVRVSAKAWNLVMHQAGQMLNEWEDDLVARGTSTKLAAESFDAYRQLNGIGVR